MDELNIYTIRADFDRSQQILCQFLGNTHDVILFALSGSIDYKRTKKIKPSRFRQFNFKVDFFKKMYISNQSLLNIYP